MTNKFEIGDKIHVEYEVTSVPDNGMLRIQRFSTCNGESSSNMIDTYIHQNNSCIVKHIPKPFQPKLGDVFIGKNSNFSYIVIGVHANNIVWLQYNHKNHCTMTFKELEARTSLVV